MRVNIYIRQENETIWNQIENKSDFVNNLLEKDSETKGTPIIETPGDIKTVVGGVDYCKHGYAKGFCKYGD